MALSKKAQKLAVMYGNNAADIAKNITIDPELEDLIPPLSEEELENLESSLLQEGCREPLIVWAHEEKYYLVDGHNRYHLCNKNNISFEVNVKKFSNKLEVKNWMLANQMSRRNLTPLQMSYLRGLKYETEKQSNGGLRAGSEAVGQNDPVQERTSQKLSEEFNVSEKTIRRDAKFSQGLTRLAGSNQKIRWGILNGQIQAKKTTISDLANEDNAFIEKLQSILEETESLEKALQKIKIIEGVDSDDEQKVNETIPLYKNLVSILRKITKLDKTDPRRKELVKEARSLFNDFMKI